MTEGGRIVSDQTAYGLSMVTGTIKNIELTKKDRIILRELAQRVAEIAMRPEEESKRVLWYKINSLQPTRPVVFCDPENGWNEIIPEETLQNETELGRHWEMLLRKEIFWGNEMGDDRPVEPLFCIPYAYSESDWGMHEVRIGGVGGGSYRWDAPLKNYKDIDKLHFPELIIDHEKTDRMVLLAEDTFGDILKVEKRGLWWWSLGMTWTLVNLRGLDVYKRQIYVIGGYREDGRFFMNTVEIYNPENNTWSKGKPLPSRRGWMESAVSNDKIYVIGGRTVDFHNTNAVEIYDPVQNEWSLRCV